MPKFNKKRGIAGMKRGLKQLPGRVIKQLPNAAMIASAGIAGAGIKGASMAAKSRAVKKAATKAASKKWTPMKIKGQKRPARVRRTY
jgi:hypothetical protein